MVKVWLLAALLLPIPALAATTALGTREKPRPAPTPAPPRKSIDGLPMDELPRQMLPARGCAAYLWSAGPTRALVAMAGADPAQLRLSLGGTIVDLPRTAQRGGGLYGIAATNEYAAGPVTAMLDLSITARADLTKGALVSTGTLRLDQAGKDSVVLPVGGLIGCA